MKKILFIIAALLFLSPVLIACSSVDTASLSVDVIDVGKADCIVIRSGSKTVMIDTGEEENLPEIEAYLSSNGITAIDVLILSHFDKDHIGCAAKLISDYSVGRVLESDFQSDRSEYDSYHDAIKERNISVEKLQENYFFSLGDLQFSVYVPKKTSYDKKEDNNASLIVALRYKDTSMLFCGDALEDRMDEILNEHIGNFDLIKLPHHGSLLDNYERILSDFNCTEAIITDSDKNPADERLLTLLKEQDINVYETRYGSVSIRSDGQTIRIKQ